MKRPAGLILSAIVLSLTALFLLLITALTAFVGIFAGHQPSIAGAPHFLTYFMLAISVFYAAVAVWAILTVIGILRLRSWARYSILVIGGGLAAIGVFALFGTLLSRTMLLTLQAPQPAVDPRIMSVIFMVMAVIYLLITAIGVWWLTYFNLRAVRDIFSNSAMLSTNSSVGDGSFSGTPTAIKFIGGFLLFSTFTCLIGAFLPFPIFLLGFILPMPATHLTYICFAALAGWMGYGLLRLKESARLLTIGFLIFGCCNIVLAALPWYQGQFRLYMTQLIDKMPAIPGQPPVSLAYSGTLILISCIWCLVVYGIVFWLLHRHRAAFVSPAPPPMLEA
jgi:hypothetical protein